MSKQPEAPKKAITPERMKAIKAEAQRLIDKRARGEIIKGQKKRWEDLDESEQKLLIPSQ